MKAVTLPCNMMLLIEMSVEIFTKSQLLLLETHLLLTMAVHLSIHHIHQTIKEDSHLVQTISILQAIFSHQDI